jgi:hypothetical protein
VSLLFVDDLIKRNTYLSKLTKPVESASLGRYTYTKWEVGKVRGRGRAKLKHWILFNNVLAAAAAAAAASADSVRSPV